MTEILIGTQIAGRYNVSDVLPGRGGMGIVLFCLDHQEDIPVALKTFRPEYRELPDKRDLFLREGAIWVTLGHHPHIVCAHNVQRIESNQEVYIVMELVAPAEGKEDASLRAWLTGTSGKGLPVDQTLLFALHIARGMKYATTKIPGLVHRDLKPANVLVGRDGNARVTDFGLAGIMTQSASLESGKNPPGTEPYIAPEQWANVTPDARTDIYAFGCIIYEMLTGKQAIRGKSREEIRQAHQTGRVEPLPHSLPAETRALVQKCLTTDLNMRYRNWVEVEVAVAKIYKSSTGREVPTELVGESAKYAERRAEGWSYNAMGLSYLDIGKYDMGERYFKRVVSIGRQEKSHDYKEEARAIEGAGFCNLGLTYNARGDARQAIEAFQQALAIAQEIRDGRGQARTLDGMGIAYAKLGNLRRALDCFQQAYTIATQIGDRYAAASTLGNMGNVYRIVGDIQQSHKTFERVLAIARQIPDRQMEGNTLHNLGTTYRLLGIPEKAEEVITQALHIAEKIADQPGMVNALGNLGNTYRAMGRRDEAKERYERALKITREIGDHQAEAATLNNLATEYENLGQIRKAIEYYDYAKKVARGIDDMITFAQANYNLAVLWFRQGQVEKARHYAEDALLVFQQVGHGHYAQQTQQLLSQLRNRRS